MGFSFLLEAIFALLVFQGLDGVAAVVVGLDFNQDISPTTLLGMKLIQVPLVLAVIAGLLKFRGQNLSSIGCHSPQSGWASAVKLGALVVIPLLALAWSVSWMLGHFFDLEEINPFDLSAPWALPAFLVVGVLAGGLAEEIQFRGFLFTRLEQFFSHWGKAAATRRAALFTSLLFASLHVYEGPAAVGAIFVVSLGLQTLYLYSDRNLVPGMVCHSLFNGVQIMLLFAAS